MRIRASLLKIAVLVVLLCLPALLRAQNQTSVTGVVTDPSGAVIPNAGVSLSNPSTGRHQLRWFVPHHQCGARTRL
jgi:hypothetical protein